MKLIRYGAAGKEKTGVIINDVKFDTSAIGEDYNEQFFENDGLARLEKFLIDNEGKLSKIADSERLGSPVARPSKIVCIGLNYKDHADETGAGLPSEPIIFMKSTTALVGPNDDITIPQKSVKTDWEVELAIVIGKKASYVEEAEALDYVAGYCLHNDVSEREFQIERGGTWDKGKGCDTFAPMGPFLATQDEISDVNNLRLWLTVNGQKMQDGTTANLIFNVPYLVSYVSQFMTLLPGDIISTGTPAGVGLGFKPPVYLKPGDVVELGIDGLGTSRQELKAYVKIDSHQHYWQYHPVKDAWITDDLKVIQKDFLPADVWPLMQQHGIYGCIAVQADQSEQETEFLVALAGENDFIKGIVGWVDLQADDIKERLARYSEQPVIKGFRHILQGEDDDRFMLGDKFNRGISLLNKYNFTYDLLIKPQHLAYAAELVSLFPEQRFVVDHMAKPLIKDQIIEGWQQGVQALAAFPNVYCKLSGLVTEADWFNHQPKDFEPYLDVIFNAFGEDRVMFGSDWPVCNLAGGYRLALKAINTYTAKLSVTEQEKFWAKNAIAFYRL